MRQTRGLGVYAIGLVVFFLAVGLNADEGLEEDYRRQYYNQSRKLPAPRPEDGRKEDGVVRGQFIIALKKQYFSSEQLAKLRERLWNEFQVMSRSTQHFGALTTLFAEAANEEVAKKVLSAPEVDFLEPNRVVRSVGGRCKDTKTGRQLWGLTRTAQREIIPDERSSDRLTYSRSSHSDGDGVDAYVLDTGILTSHVEFRGRASWGMIASDIHEPTQDFGGHGTHVAGTIGGDTVGVANEVNLIAVKVLDGQGAGTTAGMLEGIQWVVRDFQNKEKLQGKRPKAVCNLSLGFYGRSPASDYAVAHAVEAGLNMVVAAGNSYQDACLSSPRADSAITVAASRYTDTLARFSNWGSCVDIVAPGVDILSSYCTSAITYAVSSGTSMAAPHVTGAVARYLSTKTNAPTPADVKAWLLSASTKNALTFVDYADNDTVISESSTPNALLYMDCESMVKESAATAIKFSSLLVFGTLILAIN